MNPFDLRLDFHRDFTRRGCSNHHHTVQATWHPLTTSTNFKLYFLGESAPPDPLNSQPLASLILGGFLKQIG